LKKELQIDIGVTVFKNGFEHCVKELFKNDEIEPKAKELWVLLYFLRREKSYLKGIQSLTFEHSMSEEEFNERMLILKNKQWLNIDEGIVYIEVKK